MTFKYGLGDEFIDVLKTIHSSASTRPTPVRVGGVEVSPRDVVAACLPDPAEIGDRMSGVTCAGTWVTGTGNDGSPREVYLYHVADNAWCDERVRITGRRLADRHQPGGGPRAHRYGCLVGGRGRRARKPSPPSRSSISSSATESNGDAMSAHRNPGDGALRP